MATEPRQPLLAGESDTLPGPHVTPGPATSPSIDPVESVTPESRRLQMERHTEFPGYRIEGILGEGGMGIVYRARHLRLDRPVAIKAMITGGYAGPDAIQRMLNEIDAIARLRHPHIVQILDSGQVEGLPFYVMELVEGGHLGQRLERAPPSFREAAEICQRLALAIRHAHEQGIVHRDLKPSNVLLTVDGEMKITDFGIAKRAADERSMTVTGAVLGTPGYLSPEQAEGKIDQITPASDIFALGVMLYEMIAGRRPFDGVSEMEILSKIIHDDPPSPAWFRPGLPRDLETICLKCLHKKPQRRYQTAKELADDLDRFLNNQVILARRTGRIERAMKWCRRHPAWATLLAVLAIAIPGTIIGLSIANRQLSAALARSERLIENNSGLSRWIIDDHLKKLDSLSGAAQVQLELATRLKNFLEGTRAESDFNPDLTHYLANAYENVADVLGGHTGRHLGRSSDAASAYRTAIALLNSLRRSAPAEKVETDYVRCVVKLAAVVWQTEGLDAALKLMDEVEPLVRQCFAHDPARWIGHLLYMNSVRFDMAKSQNDIPRATELLDEIDRLIALQSELQAETLAKVEISFPRWVAAHRGMLASQQGDHETALTWYRRELELMRQELAGSFVAESKQHQLTSALIHVSDELLWLGELPEAVSLLTEAETICQRLYGSDPNNVYYMSHLAMVLERLNSAYFQQQMFEASLPPIQRCVELRRHIHQIDDANQDSRRYLRIALSALGNTFFQMERLEDASPVLQEALAEAQFLVKLPQVDLADIEGLGEAHLGMGLLLFKLWTELLATEELSDILAAAEYQQADEHFRLAIEAFDQLAARAPLMPRQQSKRTATVQLRAKLTETADAIRKMLKDSIY